MDDPTHGAFDLVSRREFIKCGTATGFLLVAVPGALGGEAGAETINDLASRFTSPPGSAKPWVLWHWMNGHVTREGITLDLEAMKRVGIGGFINFDAGTGIPKGPVVYLTPEWFELKQHAAREATRLGLEFGMHNCPGWSSSGGPWITPELGMQQLTWSEAHVDGGARVEVSLPRPFHKLDHYRDVAVVAYPSLKGEASLRSLLEEVSSSSGPVDIGALDASDLRAVVVRPAPGGGPAWLRFGFREPYAAASIAFIAAGAGDGGPGGPPAEGFGRRNAVVLEASDDGAQFQQVARIPIEGGRDAALATATFAAVTARYFRLSTPAATSYSQVRFAAVPSFDDAAKRTNQEFNGRGLEPLEGHGAEVIAVDKVVDLSASVDASGVLRWDAPAGRWTVLRFGHTATGTVNRSAPDTGVGLECDKYRADAVAFHFDKMMQPLLPLLKPLAERGQMWLMVDSYEVGMQNWTPGFEREFSARNGYALLPYLPAMTGRIVGSADTTDRVLWDVRRTQSDLMADHYYGKLASLAHEHGMKLVIEPYDRGPMEELQIGGRADATAGEYWQGLSSIFQNNLTMRRTPKLTATIAHVYGQGIAGAEAFTGEPESSKWQEYPFGMKTRGDENFVAGINRIMVHTYAHQPHPTAAPGMTMGPWGSLVNRNTTWWEPGQAWFGYLARCQALLQHGLFVADLAYFSGEDPGVYTRLQRDDLTPPPPEGYDYDVVSAEVLTRRAKVEAGRLVLPDGMSYRVLVLQQPRTVTLNMMRRLRGLVLEGVTLVGARPQATPSLREHPGGVSEFIAICDELWGTGNTSVVSRTVGKGRVFTGQLLTAVLDELKLPRDVEVSSASGDAPVAWIHRRAGTDDVYFVASRRRTHERLVCTFRVDGRRPEILGSGDGGHHARSGLLNRRRAGPRRVRPAAIGGGVRRVPTAGRRRARHRRQQERRDRARVHAVSLSRSRGSRGRRQRLRRDLLGQARVQRDALHEQLHGERQGPLDRSVCDLPAVGRAPVRCRSPGVRSCRRAQRRGGVGTRLGKARVCARGTGERVRVDARRARLPGRCARGLRRRQARRQGREEARRRAPGSGPGVPRGRRVVLQRRHDRAGGAAGPVGGGGARASRSRVPRQARGVGTCRRAGRRERAARVGERDVRARDELGTVVAHRGGRDSRSPSSCRGRGGSSSRRERARRLRSSSASSRPSTCTRIQGCVTSRARQPIARVSTSLGRCWRGTAPCSWTSGTWRFLRTWY